LCFGASFSLVDLLLAKACQITEPVRRHAKVGALEPKPPVNMIFGGTYPDTRGYAH